MLEVCFRLLLFVVCLRLFALCEFGVYGDLCLPVVWFGVYGLDDLFCLVIALCGCSFG